MDNEPSSVLPGSSGIASYVLKVLFSDAYLFFCIILYMERQRMRISETSRLTKLKKTLYGVKRNIFTFAIGTPENPMGVKYSDRENAERYKDFKADLKEQRLSWRMLKGKYGNEEHPVLISNINLDYAKYLFGAEKYDQESFIFGIVKDDKTLFCYYQQDDNKEFQLLDKEVKIIEDSDADDFYTEFKGYKFNIPFSIFAEAIEDISDRLEEAYGWNPEYRRYLETSANFKDKTLGSIWRYNCTHLLTESQEKRRKENISKDWWE